MNVPVPATPGPETLPVANTAETAADIARNLPRLTSAQKAAVIIALLGPEKAGPVMELIEDRHLRSFVKSYEKMASIPREVLLAAVADFVTELKQSLGSLKGGPKEARELAEQLLDEDRLARLFGEAVAPPAEEKDEDDIWSLLAEKDASDLASYLEGQRPQVCAIVLGQLSPEKAGEVLAELPDAFGRKIVALLSDPPKIDDATLATIGAVIRQEYLNNETAEGTRENPLGAVSSILSVLPTEKREGLLEFMMEKDPDKAEKIRKGLITFEDIPDRLPRNAIPVIFREMEQDTLLKALKFGEETAPGSVEYLYSNISQRMAEQYKEQVEGLGAVSKKQGEAALSGMMSLISRLDKDGTITLIKVIEADDED